MDNDERHFLIKTFSVGDLLTAAAMLTAIVLSYGSIRADVREVQAQNTQLAAAIMELQRREITPGAAVRLSAVEAEQGAMRREMLQARDDSIEFRREVRDALARIEQKLDRH